MAMRYSLLSLFSVMTAIALVLGLPVVLYAAGGWILLSVAAAVTVVVMFRFAWEMGSDFFVALVPRRRRLDEWNLPARVDISRQRMPPPDQARESRLERESGETESEVRSLGGEKGESCDGATSVASTVGDAAGSVSNRLADVTPGRLH